MRYVMMFEQFVTMNEYNVQMINQLVKKFTDENSKLEPSTIQNYINRFKEVKDNPHFKEKDITKYTWKSLEIALDSMPMSRKEKLGVIPSAEGAKEIYNKNNVRVYLAADKKACLKLGNGYSWCISARGTGSMYDHYRHNIGGTPYFVFDGNLSNSQDKHGKYDDAQHALVIFVNELNVPSDGYDNSIYPFTVTDAHNEGEVNYKTIQDVIAAHPIVSQFAKLLVKVEPPKNEKSQYDLKKKANSDYSELQAETDGVAWVDNFFDQYDVHATTISELDDAIQGRLVRYDLSCSNSEENIRRTLILNKPTAESELETKMEKFKDYIKQTEPDLYFDSKFKIIPRPVSEINKVIMVEFYEKVKELKIKMQGDMRKSA